MKYIDIYNYMIIWNICTFNMYHNTQSIMGSVIEETSTWCLGFRKGHKTNRKNLWFQVYIYNLKIKDIKDIKKCQKISKRYPKDILQNLFSIPFLWSTLWSTSLDPGTPQSWTRSPVCCRKAPGCPSCRLARRRLARSGWSSCCHSCKTYCCDVARTSRLATALVKAPEIWLASMLVSALWFWWFWWIWLDRAACSEWVAVLSADADNLRALVGRTRYDLVLVILVNLAILAG